MLLPPADPLELWGGLECTVNRVGDRYFDQIERSGHAYRPDDLDRFAALGLGVLRYPILWERTAPHGLANADWSWADERLARMRALNLAPIVGLVHHGSGPRDTSLVDPTFPDRLAAYAEAVARRYPWVDRYTPVNEPLTTARFSALYGHWHPHERSARTFARAVLLQCRGVALAMERIRQVNPSAQLVQTEDLAKIFSTRALRYQADFENERRWLTFDLLSGRVDSRHPLWSYLRHAGLSSHELGWFLDHPCPPDILGVNYYLTSERFLDHRLRRYPPELHGGNGRHAYADVAAVRARAQGLAGPCAVLDEVATRYRRPVAVTEVHNGCSREEQMRWLLEMWDAVTALRHAGHDIRAITVWALLGTYDWNSLVTRDDGHYEPGAFDVRGPEPRPTALAAMTRELTARRQPSHPVLESPGWWRRPERLEFRAPRRPVFPWATIDAAHRLLIVGARGTLGQAFVRQATTRGLAHRALTRAELDIADPDRVDAALAATRAWAVVNCAGYVRVDAAESDRDRCFRENADGAAVLAAACRRHGVRLVTFSSDLVFDGGQTSAYDEDAPVAPLNVYGESKAAAEARVLATDPSALVIRTSAFFGPWDAYNFLTLGLAELAAERRWVAADDLVVSPTYVPHLVDAALDLLIDDERGIWHLSNETPITWADFARLAAERAGYDPALIDGRPGAMLGLVARRPANSALRSRRGHLLPSLEHGLAAYATACGWARANAKSFEEPEPAGLLEA